MIAATLIVFGLISYRDLPIELMPNVEFPVITITTIFPGADPETVETEVSKRIEEEVGTLPGIKELISYSNENVSLVVIEFELEIDLEVAVQDVRDRLSRLQMSFPENVESPIVEKINFSAFPIISVAVSGEGTPQDLASYVKNIIKPSIERTAGVGRVEIVGLRNREIRVWLDQDLMASLNISPYEIISALQRSNIDLPSGRIETGEREYIVVTSGEIQSVKEFGEVVVASRKGKLIRLSDVAKVEDGLADLRSLSRLNGKPAIGLRIVKQSGANTVKVADAIKESVARLQSELPPGIKLEITADTSAFIRESFEETQFHIILGGFLAVVIVLFFLGNIRTTIIAAVTIPTSIITTFTFMRALDFSLNILTMLALALSVGMLVDDAIVVLENIFRHNEKGKDPMSAAKSGAREIAYAVLATTLSIVAVFIPVAFMKGLIGRFVYQYGITVTVAVSASYFMAMSIAPMLASRYMTREKTNFILFRWFDAGFSKLEQGYRALIDSALRHKAITVVIAILSFIGALMLFRIIPSEFQPKIDDAALQVNIEMPQGTSLTKLSDFTLQVEEIIRGIPEVENIFTTLGGGSSQDQNTGSIYIDLPDKVDRKRSKFEIQDELREKFKSLAGAKVVVGEVSDIGAGFSSYDFSFELTGDDLVKLDQVANRFIEVLSSTPGFRDVDKSYKSGKPEVRIDIDRERAADLGIDAMSLGMTLNLMVSGESAVTTFKQDGEQYDVKARLKSNFRDRPEDLLSLTVQNMMGESHQLAGFVRIYRAEGPSQIERSHGQRRITINANLDIPLGDAVEIVKSQIQSLVPPGINARITGMADIMRESFESIGFAIILAIILIYLILGAQYEHFVHPLTIMISVPLSFVGAFAALYLANMTISIMSLIGIIMLMGLVTKNAILVIDFTNQLRAKGLPRDEALKQAGPIRLRPVLMTTLATIGGMIPVAFAWGGGAGAEMKMPMAVGVIGGLITSTLLTLVVVPVVYAIFDNITSWVLRVVFRIKPKDSQENQ